MSKKNFLLKLLFTFFLLITFNSKAIAQCAGNNNSITICTKESYNQGIGNPNGVLDLFLLLGGGAVPGGTWTDLNSSGGLNPSTGILNTWAINIGGVFNYRYTRTGVPGCTINTAIITVTLGGFPGVNNPNAVACENNSMVPLFSFLGSFPNPHFNGTWSGGPVGATTGNFFNAVSAGIGTYTLTYTVPAVGTCPSRSADVTLTVHELPDAGVPTPLIFCETDDFSAYTNLDLFDQLTGEDSGGSWSENSGTSELSGPGDSFIDIQNIATTFGPGTYTFTYTVNPSHPICAPSSSNVAITIEPVVDLNGATLAVAPDICFDEIGTTPVIGTITQGVSPIPDGTYDITYEVSGANSGTETVTVTFSGGVATFTVNPSFMLVVGTNTVEITTVIDTNTTLNCTRTITTLIDTFIINENPNISDTQLTIDDFCINETGQGVFNDITSPLIELSDGTYIITFDITGPGGTVTGQVTTITVTNGNGIFSILNALTPVDGNYSLTITNIENTATNCSSAANLTDTFEVFPIPDAQTIAVTIDDICDGESVIVTISGATNLTDGLYDIIYDLSGAIVASGQIENNVLFTGGNASFTLPNGILAIGVSTLTITNLFNSISTCETTVFTNPSASFEIHAIPDASDINITVDDVCLGQDGLVNIFDINIGTAPELTNGDYTITYDLSGANVVSGQSVIVTINNGTGSFTIPSSQLTNIGNTTITIVIITNNTTGCDAIGVPIITTFDVLEVPIIDNVSISVNQPICQGENATASISGASINDGNYDLVYDITGSNTVTGQVVSVVFSGGNTSFVIPNSQISVVGSYTITITNIVDNNTPNACLNAVTNVTTTFIVSENPDTSNTILTAVDPICLGTNGTITLTDIIGTLSDGNYIITYDVSGANISVNESASVTISGGTGSFSVPSSILTNIGTTTITITSITNTATNCSSIANLVVNFEIIPLPDTTGATINVIEPICLGQNAIANLNGPALPNGSYSLTYDLSGANNSTANLATVTITATNGSFTIPNTLLTNTGVTTITLTLLTNNTTGCTVSGLSITDDFIISPIPSIDVNEVTINDICIGSDASVEIISLGGLIDGNYQINYSISGANGPSNQSANVIITGGNGVFTIPSGLLTNTGTTTITFTGVTNLDTTCSSLLNFSINFLVNALPDVNPNEFLIDDICIGQDAIGVIFNALNLVDSDYSITYNLTGSNIISNQTANITISGGTGTFIIPSALLTNLGTTTATLISITDLATGCTTSPILISDDFIINPLPDTTGTTVLVTEPICLGDIATVTINSPLLTDGTYNITYDLTGANTVSGSNTVVLVGGVGSFTIPASEITLSGNYTILINTITNPITVCSGTSSVITDDFVVNPLPDLLLSEVSIEDICIGNDAFVEIFSLGGLQDGDYDFTYSISGANGPSSQTVSVTISGGIGIIVIPSSDLSNIGLTTVSIETIVNTTTTCSSSFTDLIINFNVNDLPNVTPNDLNVDDTCLGQDAIGSILNAINLTDGDYTFTFDLTGANIATNESTTINMNSGNGFFTIPSSLLTNTGLSTIIITSITNVTTGCTTTGLSISTDFTILSLPDITGILVSVDDICHTDDLIVSLSNASSLNDGDYTIIYDLSGANNSSGNSIITTVTAGETTFIIPQSLLVNIGITTITIQDFIFDITTCGANIATLNPVDFEISDPQAPTLIIGGEVFCIQDSPTISDLTNSVNESGTIIWYNSSTGGFAYNNSDLLVNNTTYYASITNGTGCESSSRLEVTVDLTGCSEIFIPDGFSPNNDGLNDEFYIKNIEDLYPNFELEIYNRYGNIVYKGNINTPRFNGKANQSTFIGKDILPTGVYFYIVYFNDSENTKPVQGRLYLSR